MNILNKPQTLTAVLDNTYEKLQKLAGESMTRLSNNLQEISKYEEKIEALKRQVEAERLEQKKIGIVLTNLDTLTSKEI